MSADNGVYVLKTKGEWRVVHAQAIENIYHDAEAYGVGWNPYEVWAYFHRVAPFRNEADALRKAREIYAELDICEYGICSLDYSNLEFPKFRIEEYEQYQKDLAAKWEKERIVREAEIEADIKARTVEFSGEITNVLIYGDLNGKRLCINLPKLLLGDVKGVFLR